MAATPFGGHRAEAFSVSGGQLHIGDRHYYTGISSASYFYTSSTYTTAAGRKIRLIRWTLDSPQPSRFHNQHYEIPRNPSSVFTGRQAILDRLEESCLPSTSSDSSREPVITQQKRFVIHGLGGCGKTQLCLKFAEMYQEK